MKLLAVMNLLIGCFLMAWAVYFLAIGAYEFFILHDTVDYIILAVLLAVFGSIITAAGSLVLALPNLRRADP